MLRLSFPVLAGFVLLLSTGCAAQVRSNAAACTCVPTATAQGNAQGVGWAGAQTGAQAGWNGTPTAGGNGSPNAG